MVSRKERVVKPAARFAFAIRPGRRYVAEVAVQEPGFGRGAGAMLSILGGGTKLCDGITRRELMRVGALSLFGGMTLPALLRAADAPAARRRGPARSVILFNLLGGPSHQDMFDLKPDAPPEVRGEFRPIATSLPGLQVCEHLPRTAKWMHKA